MNILSALRNLHTENTALRVTEDNLRQELQECQDQRRAAFRRIEELEQRKPLADEQHPDDAAVGRFVAAMKDKLAIARQKPLTDEQQIAEALRKHGFALVKTATGYDVMKLGPCVAHNIGEKK